MASELERMQEALAQAKALLQEQNAIIQKLSMPAQAYGVIVTPQQDDWVDIATPDGRMRVFAPKAKAEVGDTVVLQMESKQIIDVAKTSTGGAIGSVLRVLDGGLVEVEAGGDSVAVFPGRFEKLEPGHRVVLDKTGIVITHCLGKDEERFRFDADTGVTWDDIGGLVQAKLEMREAVELPHLQADIFRFYNKKPSHGVMLHGPPGCGKTMLGKAAASSLAKLYGKSGGSGFMYVKGPEILIKWVGSSEEMVRQIFARARQHRIEHGYPAVIFIDEADAILGRRGTGISSDVRDTIVPMFLTEMDGLEQSGAIVIVATNRPDILDPALVRDGRIDRKIKITRPTPADCTEIFGFNLKDTPCAKGATRAGLATTAVDELFADERVLYRIKDTRGSVHELRLRNLVNGAMVVNVVDQARSRAMRRDLDAGKRSGVGNDDMVAAVDATMIQNRDISHDDAIMELAEDEGIEVAKVVKSRLAA